MGSAGARKGTPGLPVFSPVHHLFPWSGMLSPLFLPWYFLYILQHPARWSPFSEDLRLSWVVEAASCVTHSTCNLSLFSAYLNGYKVSPALPAHRWALGQEPVLLTSWSQTVSVALGYECGLCNQRPTPLHKARSPWHYCLTPLCVPWVPHLKTGPKIVPLQSTAAKVYRLNTGQALRRHSACCLSSSCISTKCTAPGTGFANEQLKSVLLGRVAFS